MKQICPWCSSAFESLPEKPADPESGQQSDQAPAEHHAAGDQEVTPPQGVPPIVTPDPS